MNAYRCQNGPIDYNMNNIFIPIIVLRPEYCKLIYTNIQTHYCNVYSYNTSNGKAAYLSFISCRVSVPLL